MQEIDVGKVTPNSIVRSVSLAQEAQSLNLSTWSINRDGLLIWTSGLLVQKFDPTDSLTEKLNHWRRGMKNSFHCVLFNHLRCFYLLNFVLPLTRSLRFYSSPSSFSWTWILFLYNKLLFFEESKMVGWSFLRRSLLLLLVFPYPYLRPFRVAIWSNHVISLVGSFFVGRRWLDGWATSTTGTIYQPTEIFLLAHEYLYMEELARMPHTREHA